MADDTASSVDSETPRTLIRGVLASHKGIETTVKRSKTTKRRVTDHHDGVPKEPTRVPPDTAKRKRKDSAESTDDSPRTVIQDYMDNRDAMQTTKKPRSVADPVGRTPSAANTSLHKKATMRNFLRRSMGNQEPTPRTLISNIMGAGLEETPLVVGQHKKLIKMNTRTSKKDPVPERRRRSVHEESFVSSQDLRSSPRRKFTAGRNELPVGHIGADSTTLSDASGMQVPERRLQRSIHEESFLTSQELRQSPAKRLQRGRNKQPLVGSSKVSLKHFEDGLNMVYQKIQNDSQFLDKGGSWMHSIEEEEEDMGHDVHAKKKHDLIADHSDKSHHKSRPSLSEEEIVADSEDQRHEEESEEDEEQVEEEEEEIMGIENRIPDQSNESIGARPGSVSPELPIISYRNSVQNFKRGQSLPADLRNRSPAKSPSRQSLGHAGQSPRSSPGGRHLKSMHDEVSPGYTGNSPRRSPRKGGRSLLNQIDDHVQERRSTERTSEIMQGHSVRESPRRRSSLKGVSAFARGRDLIVAKSPSSRSLGHAGQSPRSSPGGRHLKSMHDEIENRRSPRLLNRTDDRVQERGSTERTSEIMQRHSVRESPRRRSSLKGVSAFARGRDLIVAKSPSRQSLGHAGQSPRSSPGGKHLKSMHDEVSPGYTGNSPRSSPRKGGRSFKSMHDDIENRRSPRLLNRTDDHVQERGSTERTSEIMQGHSVRESPHRRSSLKGVSAFARERDLIVAVDIDRDRFKEKRQGDEEHGTDEDEGEQSEPEGEPVGDEEEVPSDEDGRENLDNEQEDEEKDDEEQDIVQEDEEQNDEVEHSGDRQEGDDEDQEEFTPQDEEQNEEVEHYGDHQEGDDEDQEEFTPQDEEQNEEIEHYGDHQEGDDEDQEEFTAQDEEQNDEVERYSDHQEGADVDQEEITPQVEEQNDEVEHYGDHQEGDDEDQDGESDDDQEQSQEVNKDNLNKGDNHQSLDRAPAEQSIRQTPTIKNAGQRRITEMFGVTNNNTANESENRSWDESTNAIEGFSPIHTPHLPVNQPWPIPRRNVVSEVRKETMVQRPGVMKARANLGTQKSKPKDKNAVPRLPASLTKGLFTHFCQGRVSKAAMDAVHTVTDQFWKHLVNDLSAYTEHAHRKTIEEADIALLMKRQGFVTEKQSMYTLVEKYLPLQYREQIIPIARAGNKIEPK